MNGGDLFTTLLLALVAIVAGLFSLRRGELPQDQALPREPRPGIWFCSHRAKRWISFQHLFLKLTPRDPAWARKHPAIFCMRDSAGKAYATLGAGPRQGWLMIAFDRGFDVRDPSSFESPAGSLSIAEENACIKAFFRFVQRYETPLRFSAWSRRTGPGYNCNSVIRSLADTAGLDVPKFTKRPMLCPGIETPIPAIIRPH